MFYYLKVSCVLIAEDASKPVPFGIRPKSSYIECIVYLKTKIEEPEVKKSSDSTITNKKL